MKCTAWLNLNYCIRYLLLWDTLSNTLQLETTNNCFHESGAQGEAQLVASDSGSLVRSSCWLVLESHLEAGFRGDLLLIHCCWQAQVPHWLWSVSDPRYMGPSTACLSVFGTSQLAAHRLSGQSHRQWAPRRKPHSITPSHEEHTVNSAKFYWSQWPTTIKHGRGLHKVWIPKGERLLRAILEADYHSHVHHSATRSTISFPNTTWEFSINESP